MIDITIRAQGRTVAEALTNARTIANADNSLERRRGDVLILDGVVRPIFKDDKEIGSLAGTGNDADKLAHYTRKEPKPMVDDRQPYDPQEVNDPERGINWIG